MVRGALMTITLTREEAQQVLDALEEFPYSEKIKKTLRTKLAQPEPEPVVWMYQDKSTNEVKFQKHMRAFVDHGATYEIPLYTTPPQRELVGLTDEEMMVAAFQAGFDVHEDYENEDDDMAYHWWTEDGEQCDEIMFKLRDLMSAKLKKKNS
jgi:hypothetical protein